MIISLKDSFLFEVKSLFEGILSSDSTIKHLMLNIIEKLSSTNSDYIDSEINILRLAAVTMEQQSFDDKSTVESCRSFLCQIGYYRESRQYEIPLFYRGRGKKNKGYVKA